MSNSESKFDERDREMLRYYSQRAPWMAEDLDKNPNGQVLEIIADIRWLFARRRVLEIACGTGYWTRFLAEVVEHVVATDLSDSMLMVVRSLGLDSAKASIQKCDAYRLKDLRQRFGGALAFHWISHVPIARRGQFLAELHSVLEAGAAVLIGDNMRLTDDPQPFYGKPGEIDTYKGRELPDGSKWEIVKNYPTREEIREMFDPWAADLRINFEEPRWWVTYTAR